ncbi:MAG TPA: hypothetical protein VK574_10220 [Terracidiphilus sp.]|nr:hypothetical protein [Terracidiphilus sp.]
MRLISNTRFLAIYSCVLTIVFVCTVYFGLARGVFASSRVSAAEQKAGQRADFDQITVHRINIVEPDGTPRLIIADKAEYPGSFYHAKEFARPDRRDSAGMLFINDEGSENGGLLIGGYKDKDGSLHSFGHLSFDEYEQDQTLSLDTYQEGEQRASSYQINDNNVTLMTPEVYSKYQQAMAMPDGPEKQRTLADLKAKYPIKLHPRASIERDPDKSADLRLRDPEGRTRILLRVAADGTPTMQFLDASGAVAHQWPDGFAGLKK